MATSDRGQEVGAMDLLLVDLIRHYTGKVRFFDYGISSENDGLILNEGLIRFKERHGGSTVAHKTWRLRPILPHKDSKD